MSEAVHDTLVGGIAVLCDHSDVATVDTRDGATVTAVGRGGGEFNTAWLAHAPSEPAETLAWCRKLLTETGRPFTVQGPRSAVDSLRDLDGWTVAERVPTMTLAITREPTAHLPAGVRLEQVRDEEGLGLFARAAARAFGAPDEALSHAADPFPASLLDDDRVTILTCWRALDQEPVGTAVAVRTGDAVGIYAITTSPAARRMGIGRAMTWAAIAAGARAGATLAVLQASRMGLPVYQRMGFRTVAIYDRLQAS